MNWKTGVVLLLVLLLTTTGHAQLGDPPPGGPPLGDPPPAPMAEPEQETALEGDVVVLKSGRELRGVNVIRENPLFVEVQYLPGEAPLQLPRAQVESVEYAADRHGDQDTGVLGDVRLVPHVMPGEEVTVELHRMLTAPMSEEELAFEDADYLVVLREFAARFNVAIDVHDALEELTVEERRFSRILPPETPFMEFLRNHLAEIAPDVRVILQYDQLVLQKREAMELPGDAPPAPEEMPEEPPAE